MTEAINPITSRNAKIFVMLVTIFHILSCFMYGFYFTFDGKTSMSFQPLFYIFAHGILVVVGFGLLLSYLKNLIWTGIGYTTLITVLSLEFYFMFNCFWAKATIIDAGGAARSFAQEHRYWNIELTTLSSSQTVFMASLSGGFRCALAMIIAYSAILGRGGYLQAFFVTLFGTFGYELNRQLIENYSNDSGGSNAIFVFGGFMSLIIGIFRRFKQKDDKDTKKNANYTADKFSATMALMGTLFVWVFFPILSADYADTDIASHTVYTGPYTVWYSLASSTITSFLFSALFNDGIMIRDIIYGPIAGGVIASSASYYIVNPVFGILMGIVAGLVQVVVMNKIQKKIAEQKSIFHSFSFTLFGVQGMLGGIFAAIFHAGVRSSPQGFTYTFTYDQVYPWVISLLSAAMGIAFGILCGLVCMFLSTHTEQQYFTDSTYWKIQDGLNPKTISEPFEAFQSNKDLFNAKHRYL